MRLDESYDITRLRPAPYNPRRIDEESFNRLVESIRRHGVIRPAIATDKLTILAGHQRTRAMLAAGVTHAPVFIAEHEVSRPDELRFNQLHNAVDTEDPSAPVWVPPGEGWRTVEARAITGTEQIGEPVRKTSLARMLMIHGPWSNIVATESGRVLVGSIYAAASVGLGYPVQVCYVPDERADPILHDFGQEYGEFNYENVPREQWQQASNQPKRKAGLIERGGAGRASGSHMQSAVWTLDVIPRLRGGETIFELGAGRGAYAQAMRAKGFDVVDIEFYRWKAKSTMIDHADVQHSVDKLCEHLATRGRFDACVLDSVLNSTASAEGERHVLTFLNAVCKPGGLMAMSGKSLPNAERYRQGTRDKNYTTTLDDRSRFFDDNGQTAIFSRGGWYFQKYHTLDEVRTLGETFIGPRLWLHNSGQKRDFTKPSRGSESGFRSAELWQLAGHKATEMDREAIEAAVRYEFELPYASGRTVGRSEDVLAAMREGGLL